MKVKMISSPDTRLLEDAVNEWLAQNTWVKILNITQSSGPSHLVSIWYEEPDVPLFG